MTGRISLAYAASLCACLTALLLAGCADPADPAAPSASLAVAR